MCETWPDLLNNCLYGITLPVRDWLVYRWAPWIITASLLLFATGLFWHFATYNSYPPHLRLGWMTGGEQSSKLLRGLSDYRVWALTITWLGTGFLFLFTLYYYLSPQNLLWSLGARTAWELSPTGVSVLQNYLQILWTSSIIWAICAFICLCIIWLDPYSFMRFRLELGTAKNIIKFRGYKAQNSNLEVWTPGKGASKEIRQKHIYISHFSDEFHFSLDSNNSGELQLTFNENQKELTGKGRRVELETTEEFIVWFQAGQEASFKGVKNGEDFCIGDNEESLARFTFRC